MPSQAPEIITKYEVLFAVRTGVTVLVPKIPSFDHTEHAPVFRINPDHPQDILIDAAGHTAIIKNLQQDYLEESIERGFIMLYEMQNEEVVRCTSCKYSK